MIRKAQITGGLLFVCLLLLAGSLAPVDSPAAAQRLEGAAAEQFLAQAGILAKIAADSADPADVEEFPLEDRGRNFLEPRSYVASPAHSNDQFGYALALAGNTLLVGAPYANEGTDSDQGAVYVFTRDNGEANAWSQRQRLIAGDGEAADHFGLSVALAGDTAVIGAPGHNLGASADQGAAYVFTRIGDAWSQQAQLSAGDGAAGDNFGAAVALTGDLVLVGAPADDVGANADQGAAYLFERSGVAWSELQKLTAASGRPNNRFGGAVALHEDAALIGADRDDVAGHADQGSAYIFALIAGSWLEWQRLIAGDGAAGDYFGGAVTLQGDTALIGAEGDDVGANADQGSVYIFTRSDAAAATCRPGECGVWNEGQQLTAGDGSAGDAFGSAVALHGATALIGAYLDNVVEFANQGSAYVFTRDLGGVTWSDGQRVADFGWGISDFFGAAVAIEGDTIAAGAPGGDILPLQNTGRLYTAVRGPTPWPQTALLVVEDGGINDNLGYRVALDGNTAVVGAFAQWTVYVFERNGGVWSEQFRVPGGVGFGLSLALDENQFLIGAPYDYGNQGSAYLFARTGDSWILEQHLRSSDPTDNDYFGSATALQGDTAVIGAFGDSIGAYLDQGSAYVFIRDGSATVRGAAEGGPWSEHQKLTAADGTPSAHFGGAAALDGDTILIGAHGAVLPNGATGAAYVFTRSSGVWSQTQKLTSVYRVAREFGASLALDGDTAVIGAPEEFSGGGADWGAVYVFNRAGGIWTTQQKLTLPVWESVNTFGASVAVDGGLVLVGARGASVAGNQNQGAVYVYAWNGSDWVWEGKLLSGNGAPAAGGTEDEFGISVALDGESALVGAWRGDFDGVVNRGRAHFFERGLVVGYWSYLPAVLDR